MFRRAILAFLVAASLIPAPAVGADLMLASAANQQTGPRAARLVARSFAFVKMRLARANRLDVDRTAE